MEIKYQKYFIFYLIIFKFYLGKYNNFINNR